MDGFRIRTITLVIAAALIGLGVGLATGVIGGEDETEPAVETAASPEDAPPPSGGPDGEGGGGGSSPSDPDLPREEDDPAGLEPGPSGPAPASDDEQAAAASARDYVEAINDRSGRKVCASFAEGGLDGFDLPAGGGSCPAAMKASIGFGDQRGAPVWARSEMTQDVSAQIDGDSARVVATVFTEYADVREPTIEDDIIYLERSGDRWLVVKPSATLYRAVGVADVPLQALTPPR